MVFCNKRFAPHGTYFLAIFEVAIFVLIKIRLDSPQPIPMNLFESFVNFLFLGHSEMRGIVMFVSKDERNFVADFFVGETQEADLFVANEVGSSVGRNAGGIENPTRQNDAQIGRKQTIQTSNGKNVIRAIFTKGIN